MKKTKKIIAAALAAVMALSMSALAFADTAGVVKSNGSAAVTLTGSATGYDATAHSYNAVKLFDLYKVMEADGQTQVTDSNGNNVYQYRFTNAWTDAMKTSLQTALNAGGFQIDMNTCEITKTNDAQIATQAGQNENTSDAAKLAAILAKFADQNKTTLGTTTMTAGTASNLADGYWVIYEASNSANDGTVATKPILLDVRSAEQGGGQRNITLKDSTVAVDKTIETASAKSENKDDVQIGDVIDFQVETNFPVYQADSATTFTDAIFTISDTLSSGLTLDQTAANIVVTVNGNTVAKSNTINTDADNETYTVTTTANSLAIAFDNAFIMAHQGEDIVVTYKAALNENAVYNDPDGNPNTVTVSYSNNPMNTSDVKTLTDHTENYTYAFDLRKLDGANDSLLAGAVFEMKDSSNNTLSFLVNNGVYTVVPAGTTGAVTSITTTATGDITIVGLDEDTYTLTETTAPTGFAQLANPITVVITALTSGNPAEITGYYNAAATNGTVITDAANDTEGANKDASTEGVSDVNVVVRNYHGVTLPETGSIAAIVISLSGLFAAIGGGAFVARKKND